MQILSYILWGIVLFRITLPVLLRDMLRLGQPDRKIISSSLFVTIPIFLMVTLFFWSFNPKNMFYLVLAISFGYYIQKGLYLRLFTKSLDMLD